MTVPVVAALSTRLIGVDLALRYKIPLQIKINTSDIGGPSAGLAMALAIVNALTPGELTGGKRVAVTGTIDADGRVGRDRRLGAEGGCCSRVDAQIFIVPKCGDPSPSSPCEKDLATARKRVGKSVDLAPVSTLAEALKVLRERGWCAGHQGLGADELRRRRRAGLMLHRLCAPRNYDDQPGGARIDRFRG